MNPIKSGLLEPIMKKLFQCVRTCVHVCICVCKIQIKHKIKYHAGICLIYISLSCSDQLSDVFYRCSSVPNMQALRHHLSRTRLPACGPEVSTWSVSLMLGPVLVHMCVKVHICLSLWRQLVFDMICYLQLPVRDSDRTEKWYHFNLFTVGESQWWQDTLCSSYQY